MKYMAVSKTKKEANIYRNIITVCLNAALKRFSLQHLQVAASCSGGRLLFFFLIKRSIASPATTAIPNFESSSHKTSLKLPGLLSRIIKASSEVEINTAISVPKEMTPDAYRLDAAGVKPHCGTSPNKAPGILP